MKRIIAVLLMLLWILSGCAKPDEPQQDAGALQEQPASGQETQTPEDPETHVDPKIDPQWKDPSITDEQRRWFFDFAKEYRIDAMSLYGFEPGRPMELEWFKYYCEYFVKEEDKTYVDMGVNYSGKAIEEIAKKWFGVTYGLADDDQVFIKSGSLLDTPLVELIQYRKEEVDGKTLITARCINYNFNRYNYEETVESRATYPADRAMILKGEVKGFDSYSIIDVSFYSEDGKTPAQFISAKNYYQGQIEDGSVAVPKF